MLGTTGSNGTSAIDVNIAINCTMETNETPRQEYAINGTIETNETPQQEYERLSDWIPSIGYQSID